MVHLTGHIGKSSEHRGNFSAFKQLKFERHFVVCSRTLSLISRVEMISPLLLTLEF